MSSNNVELIKNTIAINTTMICFNRMFKKEDSDKLEFEIPKIIGICQ